MFSMGKILSECGSQGGLGTMCKEQTDFRMNGDPLTQAWQCPEPSASDYGRGKPWVREGWRDGEAFLWSECEYWQCVQIQVFINSWLACAKTTNCAFLLLDVHSWKLWGRDLLLRQVNPVLFTKQRSWGCCCSGCDCKRACTDHPTPALLFLFSFS